MHLALAAAEGSTRSAAEPRSRKTENGLRGPGRMWCGNNFHSGTWCLTVFTPLTGSGVQAETETSFSQLTQEAGHENFSRSISGSCCCRPVSPVGIGSGNCKLHQSRPWRTEPDAALQCHDLRHRIRAFAYADNCNSGAG